MSQVDWKVKLSLSIPPIKGPIIQPTAYAAWNTLAALSFKASSKSLRISLDSSFDYESFPYRGIPRPDADWESTPPTRFSCSITASVIRGIKGTKMKASIAPRRMKPVMVRYLFL